MCTVQHGAGNHDQIKPRQARKGWVLASMPDSVNQTRQPGSRLGMSEGLESFKMQPIGFLYFANF